MTPQERNHRTARGILLWQKLFRRARSRADFDLLCALQDSVEGKALGAGKAGFERTFNRWEDRFPQENGWVLLIHNLIREKAEFSPEETLWWEQLMNLAAHREFSGKATPAVKALLDDVGFCPELRDGFQARANCDPILEGYLCALVACLDYVEAPGDWMAADWRLTDLYWPTMVTLLRRGDAVATETPENPVGEAPQANIMVGGASIRGVAVGKGKKTAERFGDALFHRRISVFGEQGVGKGCLLRHTAIAYALKQLGDPRWDVMRVENDLPDRQLLPLFIDMRHSRLDGTDCLDWALLLEEAVRQLRGHLSLPDDQVLKTLMARIRQGDEILLIVDGLDEAADHARVRQVDDLAGHLLRTHQKTQLVRSARWSRGRLKPIQEVGLEVRLHTLEDGDRRGFLERLLTVAGVSDPEAEATRALDLIDGLPNAPQLLRTPLFLSLFASNLPRLEGWRSGEGHFHEALLRAMFQRSLKGRRIADLAGWHIPAGYVALSMAIEGRQQIDELALAELAFDAFSKFPALTVVQRSSPSEYVDAMTASGLLRERRRGDDGLRPGYDFASEELQSWLAITTLFSRGAQGLAAASTDEWLAVMSELEGPSRVPYDRHALIRQALLMAPAGVATAYLDLTIAMGVEENLSFAIGSMAQGVAPQEHAGWRLSHLVVCAVDGDRYHRRSEDIWRRLRDQGEPPHRAPRAWAVMLGLLGGNLPGMDPAGLTKLVGPGWIEDPEIFNDVERRLSGDCLTEACLATFEILDWAYQLRSAPISEAQGARIIGLASILVEMLERQDVRAEFAVWALFWLACSKPFTPGAIKLDGVLKPEAILTLLVRHDLSEQAMRSASLLLALNSVSATDPIFDWADRLEAGARVGSLSPPERPVAEGLQIATVRSALQRSESLYCRGRIATALVVMGADRPEEIQAALEAVATVGDATPVLLALASLPAGSWLPYLDPLLCKSGSDEALRSTLLMLSFADPAEIAKRRQSRAGLLWAPEVRKDVDHFLGRDRAV